MTFQPKLVALDIDGTLVDWSGNLPKGVVDAVQRVVAADIPVVLATGRNWYGVEPVFDLLQLPPSWAVVSNGAAVVEYPPLEVHQEHAFDPSEAISEITKLAPDVLIAVEQIGRGWRVSKPFPADELVGTIKVETIPELMSRPVSRVVLRDPACNEDIFGQLAKKLGMIGVSYSVGWSCWIDIAPDG
ncbi:MAG: HAD family hydrolase, partial [Propionibacterium sp.]